MSIIDRRAVIISAAFIFIVGMVLGYLAGNEFNFDRHSYTGGVSYVVTRSQNDVFMDVGVLTACTRYVEDGRSQDDGYLSSKDFLTGCQDAYDNLNTFTAIGNSVELLLPVTPSPASGTIVPVFCRPHKVMLDELLITAWCPAGK